MFYIRTHFAIFLILLIMCNLIEVFSPMSNTDWWIPSSAALFLFIIIEVFMWIIYWGLAPNFK